MTKVAKTTTRKKKSVPIEQLRQIAHKHSVSEKNGAPKKIHQLDIEMAIREALELVGVEVKDTSMAAATRYALAAFI